MCEIWWQYIWSRVGIYVDGGVGSDVAGEVESDNDEGFELVVEYEVYSDNVNSVDQVARYEVNVDIDGSVDWGLKYVFDV